MFTPSKKTNVLLGESHNHSRPTGRGNGGNRPEYIHYVNQNMEESEIFLRLVMHTGSYHMSANEEADGRIYG